MSARVHAGQSRMPVAMGCLKHRQIEDNPPMLCVTINLVLPPSASGAKMHR
jgi:hypothetical protein